MKIPTNDLGIFWATVFGVIAVIAYTSVASWQAHLTRETINEMQAEQRAWIAPIGIWHDRQKPFVLGEAINYVLEFKNVGKSSATQINWRIENGFFPTPGHAIDILNTNFSQDDMCKEPIDRHGGIVFPDTNRPVYESGVGYFPPALVLQSDMLKSGPKIRVSQGMLDGNEAFYVRGCVTYSTMKIIGKSKFCFFGNPYKGTGGSQGNVTSIECRNGNDAE